MDNQNLVFYNGYGGFDIRNDEYVIDGTKNTPLAWSNVISCASGYPFGFIITERGDGFIWHYNSRENRLTKWSGKCTVSEPNEWIELKINGKKQGALCRLICENDEVRHGFGYTVFYKSFHNLETKVTVFVPPDEPVKLSLVEITASHADVCADLDYHILPTEPEELFTDSSFDTHNIRIKEGQTLRVVFMAGAKAGHLPDQFMEKYKDYSLCLDVLCDVSGKWQQLVGRIRVESEDREFDILMNGWLMYQTISCRLFSRSSMYQSGGAYGYRDQLQDTLCVNYSDSSISRRQIIIHASHQYSDGNVLHWWHPAYRDVAETGIKSKYSDDMLWLVYVTYQYVQNTGDSSVLLEKIGYIDAPESQDILFDHLIKSIEYAAVFGLSGLPLMRGGDWNDGMNNVGASGRGQSVWLAFFLYSCLGAICELSKMIPGGDYSFHRKKWQDMAKNLAAAVHKNAWDGKWYLRAYTDDDEPLGSITQEECKIDSISQSWSVLSGMCDLSDSFRARSTAALESAADYLFNEDLGIVRLLWPPFSQKNISKIGYIAAYPAGIRENGAYTHAAIWLARAMLRQESLRNTGYKILKAVNPINHSKTSGECAVYRIEPYVLAADIYSDGRNTGRGGWSWYTGSASWYYTTILESLFGFVKKGSHVEIDSHYHANVLISYKYGASVYEFRIHSGAKGRFELVDDGEKHVVVV